MPMVGSDRSGNGPLWIGLLVIGLLAAALFVAMEGRRQRQLVAPVRQSSMSDAAIQPYRPPPLVLPAQPPASPTPASEPAPKIDPIPPTPRPFADAPARALQPPSYPAAPTQAFASTPASQPANPPQSSASPIVYDVSAPDAPLAPAAGTAQPSAGAAGRSGGLAVASRARASRLTTIVPRGTLIPAVLETALDSTQPGQARALISEDVFNLNGDRVLIPRGSRLFGEYRADLAPGQKRAFVQWNELIRPDGAVIAIESPATDPLGRAGVRGKVNTHFAGRLGGALLQSAIDFGTLAAAQSLSNSSVIIAGPALQAGTSQLVGPPPKPTLSVRQGTQISVLVSRDLEFAPVEALQ